ncbi:hypothetical protein COO60DRAFT_406265 [Scenedesmus sp. NREL 46B-D3]|nr:hypothetical protein COO60DRAFT_406265 [Scenedesmus sp. NREL 46B-D3]
MSVPVCTVVLISILHRQELVTGACAAGLAACCASASIRTMYRYVTSTACGDAVQLSPALGVFSLVQGILRGTQDAQDSCVWHRYISGFILFMYISFGVGFGLFAQPLLAK